MSEQRKNGFAIGGPLFSVAVVVVVVIFVLMMVRLRSHVGA